ncbi:MAG TPA: hypothetical protein VN226_10150 [Anaerolineales bacterium]|nr:hypothetical protein [Anaerolineales bacterium]
MKTKFSFSKLLNTARIFMILAFLCFGISVEQVMAAGGAGDQCVVCHDSQYHNYDNGKSFCINESPMHCVDCHGGNPYALTKEAAHYDRSAHPVVGEDVSRCYVCHLDEADQRAAIFDDVAGLDLVHQACDKVAAQAAEVDFPKFADQQTQEPPLSAGSIGIALGLALTVFAIEKAKR